MIRRFWCQSCGQEHDRWRSQCKKCGAYHQVSQRLPSFVADAAIVAPLEMVPVGFREPLQFLTPQPESAPIPKRERRWIATTDTTTEDFQRLSTGIPELDAAFGTNHGNKNTGLVLGGTVLIGGDRGAGKTTLMIETCGRVARGNGWGDQYGSIEPKKTIFLSGEQKRDQLSTYIDRLHAKAPTFFLIDDGDLQNLEVDLRELTPHLLVVDSIQKVRLPHVDGVVGGIVQVKECTLHLIDLAQRYNFALVILAHVTGDGDIAGPQSVEHWVDAVFTFSSPSGTSLRVLRCEAKNRFGDAHGAVAFEMTAKGLEVIPDKKEDEP